MTEYYTVNEMYGEKFYQVPKVFFTNPLYKRGLTDTQKLAFGLLRDRFSLSVKNEWFDDQGRIYFIFTQENLMEIFDCSKQTASNIKKKLVRVGLLEIKKNGQGNPDWLYLKKPIVTKDDIYEIDKAETLGAVEESKNQTSKSLKNGRQEVQKVGTSNTDISNTDINNLEEEENVQQSELVSFLRSKDITIENAIQFETRLLEEGLTGYTNDQVIDSIEWALHRFLEGKCDEPYIYAVGRLKRVLDGKVKAVASKPNQPKRQPTRKEILPDWFDEKQGDKPSEVVAVKADSAEKKREIEDMLKKLRN